MEPVKACVDCKFRRKDRLGSQFYQCRAPDKQAVNPVTGKLKYQTAYCDLERSRDYACGPGARYFVPRQPLAKRFRLWLRGTGEPWGWPQYAMLTIVAVLITGVTHPIKPLWENFLAFMAAYFAIRLVMVRGGFRW